MNKRYRLKKDLPDAKAGEVYVLSSPNSDTYVNEYTLTQKSPVIEHNSYFKWQVENNPDWFEEIKEESKEWEIVSVKKHGNIVSKPTIVRGNWYDWTKEAISSGEAFIYSVRRISDNEIFSIGDMFSNNTAGDYTEHTITEFQIKMNDLQILFGKGLSYYGINDIKKLQPPKEQKKNERIEVNVKRYKEYADPRIRSTGIIVRPVGGHDISEYQFPTIKRIIEYVLNGDARPYFEMVGLLYPDKKYTEKDLEDAFNAGRSAYKVQLPHDMYNYGDVKFHYGTFNDYRLKLLKK